MTADPRLGRIVGHEDGTQVLVSRIDVGGCIVGAPGKVALRSLNRIDPWRPGDPLPAGWRYLDEPAAPGRAATAAAIDALRDHADWLLSLPVDTLDAAEARGYRYAARRLRMRAEQMLREALEAARDR